MSMQQPATVRIRQLKGVGWALMSLVAVAFAGAHAFNWFSPLTGFDNVLHAYTAFCLGLLGAAYTHASVFRTLSGHLLWRVALIAGAALSIGAFWEVGEWIVDSIAGTTAVWGVGDTMKDLIADSVGALLGAAAGTYFLDRKREQVPQHSGLAKSPMPRGPQLAPPAAAHRTSSAH